MPQKQEAISPKFMNLDDSYEAVVATDGVFIKSCVWDINANPETGAGTNNAIGEGQNQFSLSTTRSTLKVPDVILPTVGYNKYAGSFESVTTNEMYHCNYNSEGQHGIYVLNGNIGFWQRVVIDPQLNFSDAPEALMAFHRVSLRFTTDKDGNIVEKYLLITDGQSWQKYISVEASIKTNGFDVSLFPYWQLQPPHFDRRELLEWAVRPPMIKPIVSTIPNTNGDAGKINQLVDQAFQVTIVYNNTDGRVSAPSPFSLPLIVKSAEYLNNTDNIPKNAQFILPAGSPLTERVQIYVRRAKYEVGGNALPEWSKWYLYDTIDKYTSSGVNAPSVIGNEYWKRQNPWSQYSYDATFNTITYLFDNSKVYQLADQDAINNLQTGMPQLSYAMTDLGDAMLLGNNRYGYPNFSDGVKDNLDVEVVEKAQDGCVKPLRTMYFYAYIGRPSDSFNYTSQVGYYVGEDKQMRFGGMNASNNIGTDLDLIVNVDDSKTFSLDFADKSAFQLYLKGTPYSAIGEWYKVNADNSLVKLPNLLDFGDKSVISAAADVFRAGGYYICRFKITAPAGRYIATIGRHNVALSGDYRNTSTYIYGIANSRQKTIANGFSYLRPDAIKTFSKEMEVDCTNGDVDVWGQSNNQDTFYIYCPYATKQGNLKFRFIEGYLKEIANNPLAVEIFPYNMDHSATDDCGVFTDKNGFYWSYTKVANADSVSIEFRAKVNCQFPKVFIIPTSQAGSGWKQNAVAYLNNFNNGVVGDCNRIVYTGKITDLSGIIGYSNVAISIKDGMTAYTKQDGTFTIIVHNGLNTNRVSNVYVNAGGNYLITITNCGQVPLFNFNESLAPCANCTLRTYPIPLILGVKIDIVNQTSLKEGSKYDIGIYGADLAGRIMFVNEIKNVTVPSFLLRNNLNATFFRLLIQGALNLNDYPDIKWVFPCVTKNLSQRRYLDWVGDNIKYIDNNGNVVADATSAVFVSINITSLYNYNVANNFSLLSTYQFVPEDRLRIYDNGDGQLYDVATFGDPIDVEIFGTNFNQAAINAGLVPPETNTVFNTTAAQTTQDQSVTLIVRYDARLDKLIDKVGFWIETYTPTKENDNIPFLEVGGAYPVINGEIAQYTGGGQYNPQYSYPVSIGIDFWDTYFLSRNITIPDVGSKFFSHIFQSANITDNWGKEITSGGRRNVKDKNAKQIWLGADVIRSDDFISEGLINGLATFKPENRRNFSTYPFGDIVAMRSERNIIGIYCENDYFLVDYNFHYTYANEQGVMVTNLDNGLSTPHQKVNGKYGIAKADTGAFIVSEEGVFWYDNRNTAIVKMDYRQAIDVSQKLDEEKGGIQAWLNTKTQFINDWNNKNPRSKRWDVAMGVDQERGNIFITFRNRRNNTNDLTAYVNQCRDLDLYSNETIVYSIQYRGWLRAEGFTPEGYCRLRGNAANVEMYSFAASVPYAHNNTPNTSFLQFYGIQCESVITGVFNNNKDVIKIFQSIANDSNPNGWFIDLIYTNFVNSFGYLSVNQFKKKEGQYYASLFRNMNSYPSITPSLLYQSMKFDGYRFFGRYLVFRMVGKFDTLNKYNQLNNIYVLEAASGNNKK